MKNLYLLASVASLIISNPAFSAVNCTSLPSCTDMGYTDAVAQCPKSSFLNPTTNKPDELVLKCPSDTTKGKCIYEAAVGQIGYFTKSPNANSGWLLCNGATYKTTQYPELYSFLGNKFCYSTSAVCNKSCSAGYFAVPDYRGYFLRTYAQGSSYTNTNFSSNSGSVNNSLFVPQKEELPNLEGHFGMNGSTKGDGNYVSNGLFKMNTEYTNQLDHVSRGANTNNAMNFNANRYNSIYQNNGHVIPANYAVYIYIFAGKKID